MPDGSTVDSSKIMLGISHNTAKSVDASVPEVHPPSDLHLVGNDQMKDAPTGNPSNDDDVKWTVAAGIDRDDAAAAVDGPATIVDPSTATTTHGSTTYYHGDMVLQEPVPMMTGSCRLSCMRWDSIQ